MSRHGYNNERLINLQMTLTDAESFSVDGPIVELYSRLFDLVFVINQIYLLIFFVDENGDEDTEEPPKPDVKEVKEDDAFYSKKYVSLCNSLFNTLMSHLNLFCSKICIQKT